MVTFVQSRFAGQVQVCANLYALLPATASAVLCGEIGLIRMIYRINQVFCRLTLILWMLVPFLAHGTLTAQGTAATVSGFVTDGSGANLPNATITYTNVATGVVSSATTTGSGLYRVSGLLPGTYTATVTMQGFKTSVKQGIDLQIEAQVTLNYALEIGAILESVTVDASANLLEETTPTVSQVIEGRQVEDTPLNGRNTMNLVALTPGVVPQGGTAGAASNNSNGGAFTNANSFGNYSIAGGLASQGSVYLDGAPLNAVEGNAIAFIITQDAVQEFRVESSVINPQYGQFGGWCRQLRYENPEPTGYMAVSTSTFAIRSSMRMNSLTIFTASPALSSIRISSALPWEERSRKTRPSSTAPMRDTASRRE